MHSKRRWQWRAMIWAGLLALPGVSAAFDGDQSGIPGQIDVFDNGPVGFRVYLPISGGMCTGSSDNWAFLTGGSNPDPNYNIFVAAILTAKAQGLTIRLLTIAEGVHCHIQYVILN